MNLYECGGIAPEHETGETRARCDKNLVALRYTSLYPLMVTGVRNLRTPLGIAQWPILAEVSCWTTTQSIAGTPSGQWERRYVLGQGGAVGVRSSRWTLGIQAVRRIKSLAPDRGEHGARGVRCRADHLRLGRAAGLLAGETLTGRRAMGDFDSEMGSSILRLVSTTPMRPGAEPDSSTTATSVDETDARIKAADESDAVSDWLHQYEGGTTAWAS